MQRICVLMPYFGQWPSWFDLYLETCRFNPDVDWLFFTDLEPSGSAPPNVKFVTMSLEGFGELARRELQMDVDTSYPFKICDFRPAFGHIFHAYLTNYDFWCWGDLDVFFGDIRRFLTEGRLSEYDVISPRAGFLAGEFSLFRNAERTNAMYRESRDFEQVFTSNRCWNFCEFGFFRDRTVDSMTHVLLRLTRAGELRSLCDDMLRTDRKLKGRPFRYFWNQGRLVDLATGEDLLLYHFLDLKKASTFRIPQALDSESLLHGFFVTERGVEPSPSPFRPPRRPLARASAWLRASMARLQRRMRSNRNLSVQS